MLLLSAIASLYVYRTTRQIEMQQYQANLDTAANDIKDRVHSRINNYISLLRGTAGLMTTEEQVDRRQFKEYVDQLALNQNYPGVRGIGYAVRVKPDGEAAPDGQMNCAGREEFPNQPRNKREGSLSDQIPLARGWTEQGGHRIRHVQ